MVRSRILRELLTLAVLGAVYFGAGKLGLRLAFVNASATAGPITAKGLLLVVIPFEKAVSVFGPARSTLKSLKWAMPLPSVECASVPDKVPVPLPSVIKIVAPTRV